MSNFCYQYDGKKYVVYDGNQILTTPGGNAVTTAYKPVVERIVRDLDLYGINSRSASSIVPWHFTMIDNIARLNHKRVEQILANSFLETVDWTCQGGNGEEWRRTFGTWSSRKKQIPTWLSRATHMQMTAACCVGNAYHSLNLAFVLAKIMELFEDNERKDAFDALAELIDEKTYYGPKSELLKVFSSFELYYGIHLNEDGPILTDIIENEKEEDEIDVTDLSRFKVTIEQLLGRNYIHYLGWEPEEEQPEWYDYSELFTDESDDETEEDELWDEEEDSWDDDDEGTSIFDFLPADCWVKRFVDDEDPNLFYLVYLALDNNGNIEKSGCVEERLMQRGGSFFSIPGIEMPSTKMYCESDCQPEKVTNDLRLLFGGRAIPRGFSFIGKRLPQEMIDQGGNGGSDTEYTYAIQSAYRLAYMHMSVETDPDGVIQSFYYSTYQSSGSGYGDLFSKPEFYSDRKDEAMDMLLYMYDQYTDEEIKQLQG